MFTTRELLAFLEAMNNMAIALETSVALSSAQCDTLANTARFWEGQALRKLNDIYTAQKKARARNQKKKAGQTPSLSLTKTPPPLG